jgi:hypothetical protein
MREPFDKLRSRSLHKVKIKIQVAPELENKLCHAAGRPRRRASQDRLTDDFEMICAMETMS